MDKGPHFDTIDFADPTGQTMALGETGVDDMYDNTSRLSTLRLKVLFIGGAVVFVTILVSLFMLVNRDVSKANFHALIERVTRIEARVTDIGKTDGSRIDSPEAQKRVSGKNGTARVSRTAQQVDALARKVTALQQTIIGMNEQLQSIRTGKGEKVHVRQARYHMVARGENLYKIAGKYGLTVDKLCNFNNITPRQSIYPGQKLLVSR